MSSVSTSTPRMISTAAGRVTKRIVEIRRSSRRRRGESQIQWRVVPGRLQDLRQRHRPEVFSVAAAEHRLVADLERGAETGAEVIVVRAEQVAGMPAACAVV